jgi:hypothetical protein
MPRCPNGTRRDKKTGNCVNKNIEKKKLSSRETRRNTKTGNVNKTAEKKRCPRGTRRDKKTGNCMDNRKKNSVASAGNWEITKVEYYSANPSEDTGDENAYGIYTVTLQYKNENIRFKFWDSYDHFIQFQGEGEEDVEYLLTSPRAANLPKFDNVKISKDVEFIEESADYEDIIDGNYGVFMKAADPYRKPDISGMAKKAVENIYNNTLKKKNQ